MDSTQKHKQKSLVRRIGEAGNVFLMLFGAVGMVGVIGASTMTIMKGPVRTMSIVTKRTVAENNMIATGKLSLIAAASRGNSDCDADNLIEPIPHGPAIPGFTGGGEVPVSIGVSQEDPWGNQYAYCVWDHGDGGAAVATDNDGDCSEDVTIVDPTNILPGADDETEYVLAIISAGPDGAWNTQCDAYVDPVTPILNKTSGSDDIIMGYTYGEAGSLAAGLWKIKDSFPDIAEIEKDLEVTNSAGNLAFGVTEAAGSRPAIQVDFISELTPAGVGIEFLNNIQGPGNLLTVTGNLTAANLIATGNVSGVNGTFTGLLEMDSLSVTGNSTLGDAAADTVSIPGSATVDGRLSLTQGLLRVPNGGLRVQNLTDGASQPVYAGGIHVGGNYSTTPADGHIVAEGAFDMSFRLNSTEERLFIDSATGFVGVGTNTVNRGMSINDIMWFSSTGNAGNQADILLEARGAIAAQENFYINADGNGNGSGDLVFGTGGEGDLTTGVTEHMRISNAGIVSIQNSLNVTGGTTTVADPRAAGVGDLDAVNLRSMTAAISGAPESDPQVNNIGTVGRWCTTDGSAINCLEQPFGTLNDLEYCRYDGGSGSIVCDQSAANIVTSGATVDELDELTDVYIRESSPTQTFILGRNSATALTGNAQFNTFIGIGVGATTANSTNATDFNTGLGHFALNSLTSGDSNTALGAFANQSVTTGHSNTSVGSYADPDNTIGLHNTSIGRNTMLTNIAKSGNTAIGSEAMINANNDTTANTTANTALGFRALAGSATPANNTGYFNTALGALSLGSVTSGRENIGIGYQAGDNLTTGRSNIIIGFNVDASAAGVNETLNIGDLITGDLGITSIDPKIGAPKYCDENLTNCFVATDVGGGSGTPLVDADNDTRIQVEESADEDFIRFDTAGTERMVIDPNGSIGIGTDNPLLPVYTSDFGNDSDKNLVITSTTAGEQLAVSLSVIDGTKNARASFMFDDTLNEWGLSQTFSSGGQMDFVIENTSDVLRIKNNGNIGIGGDFTSDTVDSVLHLAAGDIRLDGGAANQAGCIRYDDGTDRLQFSHDCSSFTNMGSGGGGGAINDLSDGYTDYTDNNIFLGQNVGNAGVTTGTDNIAIGRDALTVNTSGFQNIAIGIEALELNTSGRDLIAIGDQAMYKNTTGIRNTAVGARALANNTTGMDNTAFGTQALRDNLTTDENAAFGIHALVTNTGSWNAGFGAFALAGNTTGNNNTGVGRFALYNNLTGSRNTAIGKDAAWNMTSGDGNIFIGEKVADTLTSGSNNIIIGPDGTDTPTAISSNALNIGNTIYGNLNTDSIMIGSPTQVSASNALELISEGDDKEMALIVYSSVNPNYGADYELFRAGGTQAAPTDVGNNYKIGSIRMKPYVNGAFRQGGGMEFYMDGTVTSTSMPSKIVFNTTPVGSTLTENRMVIKNNGRLGIGTQTPNYLLEVNGSAGKPGGGSWTNSSDIRLKTVDGSYDKGLKEIIKLNPIMFHYKSKNARSLPSDIQQYGFVAQDVQEIFPEAVSEGKDKFLDFNIHSINVAMVNAVKDLKKLFDNLSGKISELFDIVGKLQSENKILKSEIESLKSQNEGIIKRLEAIENKNEMAATD